jgi:hypothetical protein
VQIRERLIATTKRFAFDEGTSFAWLPTVTSVSRQALFSGSEAARVRRLHRPDGQGGILVEDVLAERRRQPE